MAKWLAATEKASIQSDLAAEQHGHQLHSTKDVLTNPKVLLLSGIYFFFTMGLYGVSFWLPSLVKASAVSDPLDVAIQKSGRVPLQSCICILFLAA